MSHKHKVKTYQWRGGILKVVDYFFETLEDAISFLIRNKHKHHHAKIYNPYDEIVEHIHGTGTEPDETTYA